MTIRKRIFYTNTYMVLASLFLLLAIGGILLAVFKGQFMNWYGKQAQLVDTHYEVYDAIPEWKAYGSDWEKWAKALSAYDFRLYVKNADGTEEYSNLTHSEREGTEALRYEETETDRVETFLIENVTILRTCLQTEDGIYELYAASCPIGTFLPGIDRGIFEWFLTLFLVVGLLAIGGILLCSQGFTKALIAKILQPVKCLDDAARRVTTGDLSTPIDYQTEDEFKNLCDSFDLMQVHLKQEMERNAAYEKARTEMVSGISHDLRTPLTSVKGYIKGILDGVAQGEEKQHEYLEIAYKKACDMDVLLSKLFFFSKLETGNMPFYFQKTQMERFLSDYVEEKNIELQQRGTQIAFLNRLREPVFCRVDKEQMQRVFDNLVENACKYAAAGGDPQTQINMWLTIERAENQLCLDFADNGAGVPEKKCAHIFEQFYRADEARSSDGNGLGLYICASLVREHGGIIRAYNEDGFHIEIRLPVEEGDEGNGENSDSRG